MRPWLIKKANPRLYVGRVLERLKKLEGGELILVGFVRGGRWAKKLGVLILQIILKKE